MSDEKDKYLLKRDKILNVIYQYSKQIKLGIIFIVIILILFTAYIFYMYIQKKQSNSAYFAYIDLLQKEKDEEAIILIDKLINTGTSSYQYLAYVDKANYFMKQGLIQESIETIKTAHDTVSVPKEYKSKLKSIEFILRSNNPEEDLNVLGTEILDYLKNTKDLYYFYNLELYASILFIQELYKESLEQYNKILTSDKAPQYLIDRSKRATAVIKGYLR